MDSDRSNRFADLANRIRSLILTATTEAGSGHPTSALSAVELTVGLFFGGVFRFDAEHPEAAANDRLIFSKGHAAPLLYALWAVAGAISADELKTLRKFDSRLEGHPTVRFPYTEAATGSLGQGLSIGVGMALNARLDQLAYRTYVLLGDSEMSEGSIWEAIQIAVHYKLDNLVGILDVNRLGQRGQTMYGHDLEAYARRISAFGWETIAVRDGHSFDEVLAAYDRAITIKDKPVMVIAKTVKGKGVSFIENKEGWHGRPLSPEELTRALQELGEVDMNVQGVIAVPEKAKIPNPKSQIPNKLQIQNSKSIEYPKDVPVATRKAYGNALARIFPQFPQMVVLDAEVSNSTFSEVFKKNYPERFFEMFIAEQNMAGVALGLARRGKIPFVSTFAAFLTRAFDQIRMAQYSKPHIIFCGSHAGVSIGEDGPSQMGLEDLAMFRALFESVVLYPSDAISTEKLVEEAARTQGIVYIRTSRPATPIIYNPEEQFSIGGSKVLRASAQDIATVVAAGITVHEALAAYEVLKQEGIAIRVIDLYSIKPLDVATLTKVAAETKAIITVEDHVAQGGLGEAVMGTVSQMSDVPAPEQARCGASRCRVLQLAVRKIPGGGKPEELLDAQGISRHAIVRAVHGLL